MYKAKLWDEDKWNIHSSSYSSSKYGSSIFAEDKKEDKKYHEQKYGAKEKGVSSDYIKKDDKETDEKEKKPGFFDQLDEDKKEQKIDQDEIPLKAAKQIFSEKRFGAKRLEPRKDISSIEEAIKKAIEEEKKIIIMDS